MTNIDKAKFEDMLSDGDDDADISPDGTIMTDNIFLNDDCMFYIYEYHGHKNIPELNLIVVHGHEETIVYRTDLKKFDTVFTH